MRKFKTLNKYDNEVNVLHFQGKNVHILPKTVKTIFEKAKLGKLDNRLSILTVFTDKDKAILAQQLENNKVPYINALPNDYDYNKNWYMPNKIIYFIDALKNKVNTDIVLMLDAYDVVISSLNKIVDKFTSQSYRILFNSTYNNYPEEEIDFIPNRELMDDWMIYFNAGCCIGYREDLIKFYEECLRYVDIENELESEQKIIRTNFANYSSIGEQRFVWIDFQREIFNSMGMEKVRYDSSENIMYITDNQTFTS